MLNSDMMSVTYTELKLGSIYPIGEDEYIEAFETDHTVESCGYIYKKSNRGILITADTYSLSNVVDILDLNKAINSLVVECSFPSNMKQLAKESKHLTPKRLFQQLKSLKREDIKIYINHIKPVYIQKISEEIKEYRGIKEVKLLKDGEILKF